MRRNLAWLLLLLPLSLFSQSTTVSTTGIVDTDGLTWSNATYQITFVPSPNWPSIGSYTWTGGALQGVFSGAVSGTGTFSLSLPSNTAISPSGSMWQFTICPNATSGCFSVNLTVTGATQDITSSLNAFAKGPRFAANPFAFGYGTVEVSPTPKPGSQFYNTTSAFCNQWDGSTWTGCLNGNYLPLAGGSMNNNSAIAFQGTGAATTLANLSGVSLVNTSPQTMAGPLNTTAINNIVNACTFTGATADVKLTAALTSISTGGTVDARCFGNSTQTIAATVTIGESVYQRILFDQATKFVPATSITMFSLGAFSHIQGLHIDTTGVAGYAATAINIPGPTFLQDQISLDDSIVVETTTTPSAGSACLTLQSASSASPVSFVQVHNFRCVGSQNGIYLTSSVSGYVTANYFSNISILNSTYGVNLNSTSTTSGSQVSGNTFTNLQEEASGMTYALYTQGPGPVIGNHFNPMVVFDGPSPSCLLSGASTQQNVIRGWVQNGCSDTSGSVPPNANSFSFPSGISSLTIGTEGGAQNWMALLPTTFGDTTFFLQNGANKTCLGPNAAANGWCLDTNGNFGVPSGGSYAIGTNIVIPSGASGYTGFPGNVVGSASPVGTGTWTAYHYKATGTPAIACGTGAGTSPAVCTITGNDEDGVINITTGSAPANAATIATITIANACPVGIAPIIRSANANSSSLTGNTHDYPTGTSTTQWTMTSNATGLAATTAYKWDYHAGCY